MRVAGATVDVTVAPIRQNREIRDWVVSTSLVGLVVPLPEGIAVGVGD